MLEFQKRLDALYEKKRQTLDLYGNGCRSCDRWEPKTRLDPKAGPKFTEDLSVPDVYDPVVEDGGAENPVQYYAVDISSFPQQVLPAGYPKTTVWGYGGFVRDKAGGVVYKRSAPGPTFEALRGRPAKVQWINRLACPHMFAVDPTLHWANPNNMPMDPPKPWSAFPPGVDKAQWPVPVVTHLHGGETPSAYDGHPDSWFTFQGIRGPAYQTDCYSYPNVQPPSTLWYHDHAMGMTRLNVYAGLAGFYLLRDPNSPLDFPGKGYLDVLPRGEREIPLLIQDRSFYTDGSLAFNDTSLDPAVHPYWFPGFIGDFIMVNGKTWPRLEVERGRYRFRILNGSNDRFYRFTFSNGMHFIQIGTDGGYLERPAAVSSLLLAPAERADVIVDFSRLAPGAGVTLLNDAPAPYPQGDPPDPETTGRILQFHVAQAGCAPERAPRLPVQLTDIPRLKPNARKRLFALVDIQGEAAPVEMLLNGESWSAPVSEEPEVGATEDWLIVNLMPGAHPIHLHLIQFLILGRQPIHATEYAAKWNQLNGGLPLDHPPAALPVEDYLAGPLLPPDPNERGWKDTARANPGEVLRIRVRFAPQDTPANGAAPGENLFPFDPSKGPGYVWHCHVLDHEDNEMMRPFRVIVPERG